MNSILRSFLGVVTALIVSLSIPLLFIVIVVSGEPPQNESDSHIRGAIGILFFLPYLGLGLLFYHTLVGFIVNRSKKKLLSLTGFSIISTLCFFVLLSINSSIEDMIYVGFASFLVVLMIFIGSIAQYYVFGWNKE